VEVAMLLVEHFLLVDRDKADAMHGRRNMHAAARVGPSILIDPTGIVLLLLIIVILKMIMMYFRRFVVDETSPRTERTDEGKTILNMANSM
jgi:hypothetical protein